MFRFYAPAPEVVLTVKLLAYTEVNVIIIVISVIKELVCLLGHISNDLFYKSELGKKLVLAIRGVAGYGVMHWGRDWLKILKVFFSMDLYAEELGWTS